MEQYWVDFMGSIQIEAPEGATAQEIEVKFMEWAESQEIRFVQITDMEDGE